MVQFSLLEVDEALPQIIGDGHGAFGFEGKDALRELRVAAGKPAQAVRAA